MSEELKPLKWVDVGEREYFETTTRQLGYHYDPNDSRKEFPWVAEMLRSPSMWRDDGWMVVGYFHTAKEAKSACIAAWNKRAEPK